MLCRAIPVLSSSWAPRPAGNAAEVDDLAHRYFPGATRSPWVATATIPQRRQTQIWTIPPKSVVVEDRDLIRSTWAQAGAVMASPGRGIPRTFP